MPVTRPPTTVASPFCALHVPLPVASERLTVLPTQIVALAGEIAAGLAFTVTYAFEEQVPNE